MCAPKGDTLPGDGVGAKVTLGDCSISLPSIGKISAHSSWRYIYLYMFNLPVS